MVVVVVVVVAPHICVARCTDVSGFGPVPQHFGSGRRIESVTDPTSERRESATIYVRARRARARVRVCVFLLEPVPA
jgi:hypothetical protein